MPVFSRVSMENCTKWGSIFAMLKEKKTAVNPEFYIHQNSFQTGDETRHIHTIKPEITVAVQPITQVILKEGLQAEGKEPLMEIKNYGKE